MTVFVAGSMRATIPLASLATQIDPAPATTLSSPLGLAIPVAIVASLRAVRVSILTITPSLQSATHKAPSEMAIAPHGRAISIAAILPLRDHRSTRPSLVAQTVRPSMARKSANPGTAITCSGFASAIGESAQAPAANAADSIRYFFMARPFAAWSIRPQPRAT